jgi:hypothetical protein
MLSGGKIKRLDGVYHYCGACREIEKNFRLLPTTATIFSDYVVFFRFNPYKPCASYLYKVTI